MRIKIAYESERKEKNSDENEDESEHRAARKWITVHLYYYIFLL